MRTHYNLWGIILKWTIVVLVVAYGEIATGEAHAASLNNDEQGTVLGEGKWKNVEAVQEKQENLTLSWIKKNPWMMYLLVVLMFGVVIRIGWISYQQDRWRLLKVRYLDHLIGSTMVHDRYLYQVYNTETEIGLGAWLKLRKWHLRVLVNNPKIYDDVMNYHQEVCDR